MTSEEHIKKAQEIQKCFEEGDLDQLFNEQLQSIYNPEITVIDRISSRKIAVLQMIAYSHIQSDVSFVNTAHMYISALMFGFHLGHDFVDKYGAIPNEEIVVEEIEKILDFEEEE